jgi:hypothetical protein
MQLSKLLYLSPYLISTGVSTGVGILIAARPDAKVLYISGYAGNVIALEGLMDENINFPKNPLRFMR